MIELDFLKKMIEDINNSISSSFDKELLFTGGIYIEHSCEGCKGTCSATCEDSCNGTLY